LKTAAVLTVAAVLLALALAPASCSGTSAPSSTVLSTSTTAGVSTTAAASTTSAPPSTGPGTTPTTTTTRPPTTTTRPPSSTTSTAATIDSGITGLVTIGPISPVEQPGVPNEKPYAATIVIRDAGGTVVAQVQSGADGRFTVKLAPGTYTVEPQNGQPLPRAESQVVTVKPHAFTEVTIAYDSGIR
jgi:hypothetical protein